MNKRDVFEHLMHNDPVFRKKIVSRAGAVGMALFNAAKNCTAEVEQEQVGQMISQDQARALNGKDAQLTAKEQETLAVMRKHKNIEKVAEKLDISVDSVRYHIRHIFNKTGEDLMLLVGKKLRHNHTAQVAQDGAVRSQANGKPSKKYIYGDGTRQGAIERNNQLRDHILVALKRGPATAGEIRERMPQQAKSGLILSKSMMGNAMTALKQSKSIRRKSGKGAKTVWRLS